MSSCCGNEVETRYCPHCGKKHKTSPLDELAEHGEKRLAADMKRLVTLHKTLRAFEDRGRNDSNVGKLIEKCELRIANWKRWLKALTEERIKSADTSC